MRVKSDKALVKFNISRFNAFIDKDNYARQKFVKTTIRNCTGLTIP